MYTTVQEPYTSDRSDRGGVSRVSRIRGAVTSAFAVAVLFSFAAPAMAQAPEGGSPLEPLTGPNGKPYEFVPKPAGTKEDTHLWYGPYTVPPGHDMNRVDLDLPMRGGF